MGCKGYYLDKLRKEEQFHNMSVLYQLPKETEERPWTLIFFYLPFQPSLHQNVFNQHTTNIDLVFKVGIQQVSLNQRSFQTKGLSFPAFTSKQFTNKNYSQKIIQLRFIIWNLEVLDQFCVDSTNHNSQELLSFTQITQSNTLLYFDDHVKLVIHNSQLKSALFNST